MTNSIEHLMEKHGTLIVATPDFALFFGVGTLIGLPSTGLPTFKIVNRNYGHVEAELLAEGLATREIYARQKHLDAARKDPTGDQEQANAEAQLEMLRRFTGEGEAN